MKHLYHRYWLQPSTRPGEPAQELVCQVCPDDAPPVAVWPYTASLADVMHAAAIHDAEHGIGGARVSTPLTDRSRVQHGPDRDRVCNEWHGYTHDVLGDYVCPGYPHPVNVSVPEPQ